MSLETKRAYLKALWVRYKNSTKREKTVILDEFCAVCGYSRKHAIALLSNKEFPNRFCRPGPKSVYGLDVVYHLLKLWRHMGKMCSKKMKAALPLWLPFYKDKRLTAEMREQLLQISASTMDRLLKPYKKQKGLSTTSGSWIKSKIPIELLTKQIEDPGCIEADTVSHCGESAAGSFISSLTMTDLHSGWTENRAVWTKAAENVLEAIEDIENSLPFKMRGFACDNGVEFLNDSLHFYFVKRETAPIKFVRRRPYKKNDAAHVEQKNFTHVRQLFGYERLDDPRLCLLMNEIYKAYWNPLLNFFTPTMKLIKKKRMGGRIKKIYDTPKPPAQRLIDHPGVPMGLKQKLKEFYSCHNPFSLKLELDKKLNTFYNLVDQTKRMAA